MIRFAAGALLSLALASLGPLSARSFVIEAEDFDHDGGQHPPIVDEMPYYGGGLSAYTAIAGIDFDLSPEFSGMDIYRYNESPNVPIRSAFSTVSRGEWDVLENYTLALVTAPSGGWFNYTRVIPAGRYRVYAGLSWGDNTTDAVAGQLALVTGGLGTPNQTLAPLGGFLGNGSGTWDSLRRVPLREGGQPKVVDLDGTSTFRYSATAGDLDYLMFVPETMPGAEIAPTFASIPVGGSVTLTAQAVGSGPLSYQWLRDGIDLPGANQSSLQIASAAGSAGGRYSVRVTNPFGTWVSDPTEVRVYFPIQLGDLVAPNVPYPSAGLLQGTGQPEQYEYRFEAQAGQAIRIERLSDTDCNEVRFRLSGPGQEGFFGDLSALCGGPGGAIVLQATGTYSLLIEAFAWSGINEYSFRLSVPPVESQSITLGETVSDQFSDVGVVKEYTFDVQAPTDVFFSDVRGATDFFDFLRWTVIDPDGQILFQRPLMEFVSWGTPTTYRLSRLGTYRILVAKGAGLEAPFEFLATQSVIQVHDIVLDQVVGPGTGTSGVGLTEIPGEVDRYRFAASAGDTVYFRQIPNLEQCAGIAWQVTQPDGSVLFFEYMLDNCSGGPGTALRTLTQTGTYLVNVYSPFGGTGTHSFEVMRSKTPERFDLSLGTRVGFNQPSPGAGFIEAGGTYDDFIVTVPTHGFHVLEDRGSTDSLMVASLEADTAFSFPIAVDVLDRVSGGLIELQPGRYRIRVRSSDPLRSGRYRFRLVRNEAPVAVADTFTVNRSRTVTFPKARLMENDNDPDEDRISFSYVASYSDNGGLVEDLGKRIRYTAPADFHGVDTFMYGITDDRGLSGYAPVSIVVP